MDRYPQLECHADSDAKSDPNRRAHLHPDRDADTHGLRDLDPNGHTWGDLDEHADLHVANGRSNEHADQYPVTRPVC